MSEYTEHLRDVFHGFGPIQIRRMFGGQGIFRDGLMFALVAGDSLYLKADANSMALFESRGLERFRYTRGGKTVHLSYFAAPDSVFDDPDEATRWATLAYEAARRAARP